MSNVPGREVTIGERIRALRGARKLSQQQLADELGTTRLVVHRWEKGRERGGHIPSQASAEKLAAFFDQPLEVFFKPPQDTRTLARLERIEVRLERLEILMDRIDALSALQAEARGQ